MQIKTLLPLSEVWSPWVMMMFVFDNELGIKLSVRIQKRKDKQKQSSMPWLKVEDGDLRRNSRDKTRDESRVLADWWWDSYLGNCYGSSGSGVWSLDQDLSCQGIFIIIAINNLQHISIPLSQHRSQELIRDPTQTPDYGRNKETTESRCGFSSPVWECFLFPLLPRSGGIIMSKSFVYVYTSLITQPAAGVIQNIPLSDIQFIKYTNTGPESLYTTITTASLDIEVVEKWWFWTLGQRMDIIFTNSHKTPGRDTNTEPWWGER